MLTKDETKKLAAMQAFNQLEQHMTIGVGTGSTVYWFIQELAARVEQGFACTCVPTSRATSVLAAQLGIPLVELNDVDRIDLTIDGADEADPQLRLIKGGGGALLQEKMVAAVSDKLVIIADSSKQVKLLGAFPLPVEVIPYGWKQVQRHIRDIHQIPSVLRMKADKPFVTDHGHFILDCHFGQISDAEQLGVMLHAIPGVVEHGLFIGMAASTIIAFPNGEIQTLNRDNTAG